MKNKLALLFAITAVFAVSAVSCGNDEPEDSTVPDLPVLSTDAETTEAATTEEKSEETTEVSTEKETEAEETTEQTTEEATEEATEAEEEPEETDDSNDEQNEEPVEEPEPEPTPEPQTVQFSFSTLHSDASGITSALGEASDVTTAPACFANGADSKIYTYDGLVIECYVLDGVEKVCCVTITSSNYSTDTGITIGSSQADVEALYGAGEVYGDYTIYINGNSELDVKYNGGIVSELVFYTAV